MNIWTIIKNMSKQLLITAIVIAISIAIMSVNETAGIILMMLYSAWMVVKSSNKEMPLNKFTALLPGVMSLAIFFIMLTLVRMQDGEIAFIGIALGVIPGWLMARGHNVYKKNGVLYAKRTFLYVLIWAASFLFSQGLILFRMWEITNFGSLLNGFSTAMMVVLSMILFKKTISIQGSKDNSITVVNTSILFIPIIITLLTFSTSANAQNTFTPGNASSMGSYSGAPPAILDWGVRYGETEYKAVLNPEAIKLMNARKGRWFKLNTSGPSSTWYKLNSWSFSGGRLIVDWDKNIATLEPIYTTASVSSKVQYNKAGKMYISHKEHTETAYLKNKQTGDATNILFPVAHGLGHPVSIGPGSLAGEGGTDTAFFIVNYNSLSKNNPSNNNFPTTQMNYLDNYPNHLQAYTHFVPIAQYAANAISAKSSGGGFSRVIFIPVKTVGRVPSSPSLSAELKSQYSGWGKSSELSGTQFYKGRFLSAVPSLKDRKDGIDICNNIRNALASNAKLTIDWDSKTANLSSFSIQWDASNTYISQGQKHIAQAANKVMEFFKPSKGSSAKVAFDSYAFRDISGGQLTYSHYENYKNYGSNKLMKKSFDPVVFRDKPVKIQWQAVPWKNGSILVRLYVRPSTIYYSQYFHNIPAYFDLIFEKTTQSSSSEGGSTGQDIGGSSEEGSTGQNNGSQFNIGFPDEETAVAGAITALLMLLGGLGMNAATIAAQGAAASAEEAVIDANTESSPLLFDPYDDEQLPEEDGMYWDGYAERWMNRDEAEHFVSKLNQEKSEADTTRERELDAFEDKNEIDRDERQNERAEKLRDEGNIYNEKHETWEKSSDYVPPRTDLDRFYTHVDYLEEHSHQLSDDRQKIVKRILDRIGYENNAIDPTQLTDENMKTMDTLTKSINTIIHSENEANIAQQDSSTFEDYETLGEGIEYVGKQFGEAAEHMLTKGQTKGAITSFIYETAGNHDKSIVENLKNSTFESVKTYSGNRWADMADEADKIGEITINAAWGAMMETGKQLDEGKGMDGWEILKAAGEEAITDQLRSVFSDAAKGELDKIAEIKTKLNLDHISNQNSSELSDGFVDGAYKRFNHLAEQFDVNFDALSSQHFSEVADTLDGAFKNLAERLDDI